MMATMSNLVIASAVDALPSRMWALGNIYPVFGRRVHLCVGDGVRTVELDGREIARGRHVPARVEDVPSPFVEDVLQRFDLGWLAVGTMALLAVLALAGRGASAARGRG